MELPFYTPRRANISNSIVLGLYRDVCWAQDKWPRTTTRSCGPVSPFPQLAHHSDGTDSATHPVPGHWHSYLAIQPAATCFTMGALPFKTSKENKCPAHSWTSVQWQLMALENKMSCKLMDLSTMTTHGIGKQNVLQTHGPQYNDRSWHQQQCDAQAQQCLQLPAVKYLLNFPLKHLNCQSMTQKLTWCPN